MKRKIALAMCTVMCVATVLNGCGKAENGEKTDVNSQDETEGTQKEAEDSEGETDEKVHELSKYLKDNDSCIWYEVNMYSNPNNIVGKDSKISSIYIFKDGKIACVETDDADITLGKLAQMNDESIIELAKEQQTANCERYFEDFSRIDVYTEPQRIVDTIIGKEATLIDCKISQDLDLVNRTAEKYSEELENSFTNDCQYKETMDLWNMGVATDLIDQMIELAGNASEELANLGDEHYGEVAEKYKKILSEEFKEKLESTGYAEKVTQPYIDKIKSYQEELQYYPYAMCLQTDATGNAVQSEYLVFSFFNGHGLTKPYDTIYGNAVEMVTTDAIEECLEVTTEAVDEYNFKPSVIDEFEYSNKFVKNASFRFDLSSNMNSQSYEVYDTNYAGFVNYSRENPIYLLTKVEEKEGFTLDRMGAEGVYLDDFDSATQQLE